MDEALIAATGKAAGAAEGEPLAVSPGRWWVLATFTLMAAQQGMVWVIPGALAPNFQLVYGMGPDMVQFLLNYGCFLFILVSVPSALLLDRVGVRVPVLLCIALMLLCNLLRALATSASVASLACVHLSCILDAIVGPIAMAAPSKLAEDFFPPEERTTATAIAALGNQSGNVVVYLLIPLLASHGDGASMSRLNYFLLALSLANALAAAAHFPALPPRPPSRSSAHQLAATEGGKAVTLPLLLRAWRAFAANPAFLAIAVTYSLCAGLTNAAGSVLPSNLAQLGATQAQAGWVGAAANLGSIAVGCALAAASDALKRRSGGRASKALVVACAALSGLCFGAFAWCSSSSSAGSAAGLWAACAAYCLGMSLLGAQICLSFDLAAEHTFHLGPEGAMLMGIVVCVSSDQRRLPHSLSQPSPRAYYLPFYARASQAHERRHNGGALCALAGLFLLDQLGLRGRGAAQRGAAVLVHSLGEPAPAVRPRG